MNLPEQINIIINKYITEGSKLNRIYKIHCQKVAKKSIELLEKSSFSKTINKDFLIEAAFLHDIGIVKCNAASIGCFGKEPYIKHGIIGAEILIEEGFHKYSSICETHIGSGISKEDVITNKLPLPMKDMLPKTPYEKIICIADKFYSKSKPFLIHPKPLELIEYELEKNGKGKYLQFLKYLEELNIQLYPNSVPATKN